LFGKGKNNMDKSQIDPQDMFSAIYRFPDQMLEAIEIGKNIKLKNKYSTCKNVILTGMGGSAIGGDVIKTILSDELKIPFYVNRNYDLPNWVNKNTLVICSSYSGNTEETLSAYEDAVSKGAMIIGISTGGKLSDKLNSDGYDLIKIIGGLQPRAALAYSFIPVLFFLNKIGLASNEKLSDLNNTITILNNKRDNYSIGDSSNPIFKMAKDIYGMVPVIYGVTDTTGVVALRWKGQLCENSKMIAYHNEIPELNHNEIVGWGNNLDLLSELVVIWLYDKYDNNRIKARQDITKEILNEIDITQHEVHAEGANKIERLLDLINFGDWLSYWCAILHNTDPSPVEKINKLKQALENIN
jgi:glucose/mannose-6-phosphate isomerase